jgi:hypothetical protein
MELMELVENEPTTRPFQCDWQTCTKVRELHFAKGVAIFRPITDMVDW